MASYLAIARKWRPHRFEDLVGQSHVVQTLNNAITLGRVSHAYLFSGSRGIGKTSVARIFAKALRCPNATQGNPCNECSECRSISDSRSVDVVEIDGASNNGVEAVRGIRENVAYGASSGTYKIYIIDEVHMLSISAFNALLKTLEEPPAHVVFIFATTEVQKIPLTIVSRCQRFEFRRLTNAQVVARLQFILKTESLAFSEESLRTIASHSDGSLRDALSLLDQVLSFYGTTATTTELNNVQVVEALGVSDSSSVRLFLALILQKNIPALLKLVGDTYFAGIDLKHFTERSLEELRYLYLFLAAKESKETLSADGLDISQTHFTELEELTREVSLLHIERMAQVLSKTVEQLGWSTLPRFVLEMAAVRLTKVDQIQQIEAALLAPSTRTTPVALRMITNPTAVPLTTDNYETAPETSAPPVPAPVAATPTTLANSPPFSGGASAPTYNENSTAPQAWKSFVDTVMKRRPLLGALLSHANFNMETGEQGKVIVLAFAADSFYERQASDLRNKSELEEQIRQFFGREARLVLSKELSQTMRSLEETRNVEEAIIKKGAIEHPEVVKAKSLLGAEIVDVDIKE